MGWGSSIPDVSRGQLDFLGWHSKRASLGYDQSVSQVVVDVQRKAADNIAYLGSHYSETELHRKMAAFLSERSNQDFEKVHVEPSMLDSVAIIFASSPGPPIV